MRKLLGKCGYWDCALWNNPKCKGVVLPPGSMGFPLIGETLQMMIPSYSIDLQPFIKTRIQKSRYFLIFYVPVYGSLALNMFDKLLVWDLKSFFLCFSSDVVLYSGPVCWADQWWYHLTLIWIVSSCNRKGGRWKYGTWTHFQMSLAFRVSLKWMWWVLHTSIWEASCLITLVLKASKQQLLPQLQDMMVQNLHKWSAQDSVEVKRVTSAVNSLLLISLLSVLVRLGKGKSA